MVLFERTLLRNAKMNLKSIFLMTALFTSCFGDEIRYGGYSYLKTLKPKIYRKSLTNYVT